MKRAMKSFAAFMIAVMMVAATAGTCISAEAAAKAPKKITLKATVKTVDIKGKTTVSVKSVKPKNASKAVTFKSSNKKIATVNKKGVVTGKKKGTVKITATSKKNKKIKQTIKIKVKQLTPKSISLNQKKLELVSGAGSVLKATIKPVGVYCPVTWKSSNTAVATVDKNGKVTAKAEGTANITVTSKEKKTVKAVCAVTVKSSAVPPEEEKTQYMTCDELETLVSEANGAKEGYKVLDIRKNADYQTAHVRHSISASVDSEINPSTNKDGNGKENLEKVINIKSDEKYVLICYTGNRYAKAATQLLKGLGIDNSRIYTLEGGFKAWSEAKTQYIEAEGLKNLIDNGYKYGDVSYIMLDVREKTSSSGRCYDKSHIIGSVSATVKSGTEPTDEAVQNSVKEVIKDTIENENVKYVLICHSGNAYAKAATALLKQISVKNSRIITLQGGYNGWETAYPEYVYVPGESKHQSGTVTANIDMSKYEKGKTVRVWLQKPQDVEGYQRITNVTCSGDAASGDADRATVQESDGMYYIEWGTEAAPETRKAQVTFHVERDEILRQDLTEKAMTEEEAQKVAPYLESSSTIPVDNPTLKAKAAEITEGKAGYLGRAKAIYDWVIANMERDGSKPYCGDGDVLELLKTLKGKCTDINSVFVGLCRASGVPARERFGIRINADDISKNQHCWAEFYLPGTGWVAADPADVLKYVLDNNEAKDSAGTKEKQNYYWGNCDEKRVELSNGRDLTLTPAQWGKPLNTFGYPYAEVGSQDNHEVICCYDGVNFVYNIGFTQD